MKHSVILGIIAAAISTSFTSCSSEDTLDTPTGKAIQFSGAYVDLNTRAAADPSITTANISEFNVFGWVSNGSASAQIFNNEKVTRSGDDWTYANKQYWIDGGTYTFAAIYPADNGTCNMAGSSEMPLVPVIADFTCDGETDLIYATASATGKAAGNDKVDFNFQHMLAKAKFTFQNATAAASNLSIKVTDVKITDAYRNGTVNLSIVQHASQWNEVADATLELQFGDIDNGSILAAGDAKECDKERLFIPTSSDLGTEKDYNVTFNVTLYQAGIELASYKHKAIIAGVDFDNGYAYNFTATLDESNINPENELAPIEFTCSKVEEWEESDANGEFTVITASSNN